MPPVWHELRSLLMTRIFYDFSSDEIGASTDLLHDGYLNSTSILVMLGVLDDALGGDVALGQVRPHDTTSLATIEALYSRLLDGHRFEEIS